ncbi:putative o-succinylbenzoate synthase [Dietzia timorensis]|uniref:o-succinylbenzoate synthase n=2 Tax=Dietzia timorensis TaxID=499555 RepID=A0A173LN28_9ACTN|nr:putative o-succinylbenzoate synthase [Dietzia timorensis]
MDGAIDNHANPGCGLGDGSGNGVGCAGMLPALDEIVDRARVVSLPMRVRFRDVTQREALLVEGPAGWGEFAPFAEYGDAEAAAWLASALEMAWQGPPQPLRERVPVNATVPSFPPAEVAGILDLFPGCRTVKVKVGPSPSTPSTLDDDAARVSAALAAIPGALVRVDANRAWTVAEAYEAARVLGRVVADAGGQFEYMEQPCATVPELAQLRGEIAAGAERGDIVGGTVAGGAIAVAADESIRRAEDPLLVAHAGGADRAVVKAPPLGGPRRLLSVAASLRELGLDVTVSSALDTAVGMGAGLAAAAALPAGADGTIPACGLGTGGLFEEDVAEPRELVDGTLSAVMTEPDPARLGALAASGERRDWWIARLQRCYEVLAAEATGA